MQEVTVQVNLTFDNEKKNISQKSLKKIPIK